MENDKITAQDEVSSDLAGSTSQPMTNNYNNDVSNSNFGQSQVAQPSAQTTQQSAPINPTNSSTLPNQPTEKSNSINPMTIVIQWLTYAFWGWTAIAILIITIMLLNYQILGKDINSILPYNLASILVLFPISVICDFIYRKNEPGKKTGASSVVMIIHAVIFALCFVSALVTLVLNLVKLMISTSDSTQIWIYSAIIMVVVYAALFFRTIVPEKLFKFRYPVVIFMSLISIALVAIGLMGPVVDSVRTKNDRLIVDNLSNVVDGISEYVDKNDKLPDSLENVTLNGDAKTLVSKNLVKYVNEGKATDDDDDADSYFSYNRRDLYKYQLCVDYIKASNTSLYGYSSGSDYDNYSSSYSSSVSAYSHPKGEVCYKLKAYAD